MKGAGAHNAGARGAYTSIFLRCGGVDNDAAPGSVRCSRLIITLLGWEAVLASVGLLRRGLDRKGVCDGMDFFFREDCIFRMMRE